MVIIIYFYRALYEEEKQKRIEMENYAKHLQENAVILKTEINALKATNEKLIAVLQKVTQQLQTNKNNQ